MSSGSPSKLLPLLAVLVILVVAYAGMRACRHRPGIPKESIQLADALTTTAVQEAVTLAGAGGDVVLVGIDLPPSEIGPFAERYMGAFKSEAAARGLVIRAEEKVPPSPRMEETGVVFSKEAFLSVLSQHADAKLMVFFVPPPPLSASEAAALPAKRPKIMLVTNWQAIHLRKLPKGIVQTAIVPRTGQIPSGVGDMDFAAQFEVVK